MTKPHSAKLIRQVLRDLGLHPCSHGNGRGYHETWEDAARRRVNPRFSGKEMQHPHLYSLGASLEVQGICLRKTFIERVRSS